MITIDKKVFSGKGESGKMSKGFKWGKFLNRIGDSLFAIAMFLWISSLVYNHYNHRACEPIKAFKVEIGDNVNRFEIAQKEMVKDTFVIRLQPVAKPIPDPNPIED